MNISQAIPSTVQSISFSFLTSEDVRRISVKQIVNPVLLDDLNRPNVGGLYDPALGPSDKKSICSTCRLTYFTCPGHYGHIELPAPVYHPLFFQNMYKVMKGMCTYCHRFKMSRIRAAKYIAKLRLLDFGLLDAADSLANVQIRATPDKEGNADEETVEDESLREYEARLNAFVAISIARTPNASRDGYKQGLVYQARKALISEFLTEIAAKKCAHEDCLAFSHSLRAEAHSKIIELDLTTKQKVQHEFMGQKRIDVLLFEREGRQATSAGAVDDDAASEEISSDEGEPTVSDEDAQMRRKTEPLPKSVTGRVKTARGRNERIIPPEECRAHLRRLFDNEKAMCALIFGRHGPLAPVTADKLSMASADMFFLDCLLVSPTRFRPPAKMGDTIFEHPHNELLAKLLNTTYRIRDQNHELRKASAKGSAVDEATQKRMLGALLESLVQLQVDVNSFMDSSKNPTRARQGKLPTPGVKQNLEKKEGLFRMHMMGKRVNFAARSVISPDVNIEPNEIGVPPIFAHKLYIPEPVTDRNVHRLRELVINGPHKYPGASILELEDGTKRSLEGMSDDARRSLARQLLTPQNDSSVSSAKSELSTKTPAINKKVYRHLRDGDILILNRQPTLHKPSMMAHKAKVLQGEKTIRMHYANCNSYNADFDGDEMNIHFPQNEIARSEAMFIANTDNQYLVPTSGKPLRGLIQDHVVAGVWMTNRDSFFTREEYFQLLYGSLRPEDSDTPGDRLRTLPPTVWKPKPLWTGKQVISTVMLNLTPETAHGLSLTSKTKVAAKLWGPESEEGTVIFKDGELLCGVMDKSQFGASDYGLVHSVYELYGPDIAGKLLGVLSRLFTRYLQHRAFTCRMDDLTLTASGDSCRKDILGKGKNLGTEGAIDNFPSLASTPPSERQNALRGFLQDVLRDDSKMAGLDVSVKKKLSKLTESVATAIMPDGLQRKFPYNHMQMMTQSGAKGSAVNAQQISCLLGQQELEGRRVPVMISGKTLPSFKAFETAAVAGGYVASRFLTGVKPQEFYFHCMAGREGLIDTAVKTSRSGYLQRCLIKHLEGIRVHYDNTVRGSDSSVYQFHYGGDSLDVTKQKHLYQFEFSAANESSLLARYKPRELHDHVEVALATSHMKKVLKRLRNPEKGDSPVPTMSQFNPTRHLGSTSEKFALKLDEYIKKNPDYLLKPKGDGQKPLWISRCRNFIPHHRFRTLMQIKYMKSLIEPGEAVGLLASQGVGEPSTQMTLNTFHFAGHGAANVTLGIPRLREIVMTASTKPKTPSMTLPVRSLAADEDALLFCKQATRLRLSEVTKRVEVDEQLLPSRQRRYTVNIHFYPKDEYRDEHNVEPAEILAVFGVRFPSILRKEIQNELKKLNADIKSLGLIGKGQAVSHGGGNEENAEEGSHHAGDDASEVGDGDADHEKRARQGQEVTTYDIDEEDNALQEEYDDAAIEAEFAEHASDKDLESEEDNGESSEDEAAILKKQTVDVRLTFCTNLKAATSFVFTDEGARFDLEFNSESPKLLLVDILEKTCQKTVIREIPGIADCFFSKETTKGQETRKLVTNGSNLRGLWGFTTSFATSVIEENDIKTNDIYASLITYGVEMARAIILNEVQGVFGAYNIDVDIRHLELIADYMTYDGGYKPFNRKGISTNSSPLLKASYETTAAFLSDATLHGDFDDLRTPSGNIVLGRPSQTGTGVFDIVQNLPH